MAWVKYAPGSSLSGSDDSILQFDLVKVTAHCKSRVTTLKVDLNIRVEKWGMGGRCTFSRVMDSRISNPFQMVTAKMCTRSACKA